MAEVPCHLPFGVTCEFVAEDGDAVDSSTGLKVGLDIFGRRTIVNLYVQKYLGGGGWTTVWT